MNATLNRKQLLDELVQITGAKIVTIKAVTEPRLNKTAKLEGDDGKVVKINNPFETVLKTARIKGLLNFHYAPGVLRRLAKEGKSADCFRQGDSWHEPVFHDNGNLTPLCRHKTTLEPYLRFMVTKRLDEPSYATPEGKVVTLEQIKHFLPTRKRYENQGLDEPLEFLTYALSSLVEINLGGNTYTLEQEKYHAGR